MKRLIIMAALILAAIAPMSAQDFTRLNDTTWVRNTMLTNGIMTEYASSIDNAALTVKINNDLRNAALCQAGAFGMGMLAGIESLRYAQKQTKARRAGAIAFGVAAFAFEIASVCHMYQERMYLTPEGVIVKIGRTEKPGAYAKPKK